MVFSSTELPKKSVVTNTINTDLFKVLSLKNSSLSYADLPTFLLPYLVVTNTVTSMFQLRTHFSPAHYSLRPTTLQCDFTNKKLSVRNSLQNEAKGER